MSSPKRIVTIDAETDPFLYGRVPVPFIWGLYDGKKFETLENTRELTERLVHMNVIAYAHNGGKFDFMYLLPFIGETKAQIINGRIVAMMLGKCELRDSFAIIPEPLRKFGFKKEIEMWKLERHCRQDHISEITEYLKQDCVGLWNALKRYREIAGTHKTIASNALAFARKLDIDVGKTNHTFDRDMRPYYFGGRCQLFQEGTHRNITLLDIHSAYPSAMLQKHSTGSNIILTDQFSDLKPDEIDRSFIKLECFSNGAFPIRIKGTDGGLFFPHEYNLFHVTGWEYRAAKELGLISDEKIISIAFTRETISFEKYVNHWFKYKSQYKKEIDPVNYTIGKIMLNSLYGKLAQNPARYYDFKIVKAGTPVDHENGWSWYCENENHEIHRRESLWKWKFELGKDWTSKPLYKNVATGASITGYVRAILLRAIYRIGPDHCIYCDTDGLVVNSKADLSKLDIGPSIGQWGIEEKCAPIGHFAGKKLYGVKLANGENKIACKGAKLDFDEIERVVNGETISWKNQAPTFHIDGRADFLVREIRSRAKSLALKN